MKPKKTFLPFATLATLALAGCVVSAALNGQAP